MKIDRLSDTDWLARAPAKINLFFEVIGKRVDGFHEIVSLISPVSLYDTLNFRLEVGDSIRFSCEGAGADVPVDSANIVVRALERVREFAGICSGANVELRKNIPSQAGLGGGSADAAAALLLAVAAWEIPISDIQLINLAAELGSDVPLFLADGPVLCRGRGEIITPIADFPQLDLVILKPDFGLSAAVVYSDCMKYHDGNVKELPDLATIRTPEDVAKICFNRLERPAFEIVPELAVIKERFASLGCLKVMMSGSGTSLFGICRNPAQADTVACELEKMRVGDIFRGAGCGARDSAVENRDPG